MSVSQFSRDNIIEGILRMDQGDNEAPLLLEQLAGCQLDYLALSTLEQGPAFGSLFAQCLIQT